jgi:hypothetical protein
MKPRIWIVAVANACWLAAVVYLTVACGEVATGTATPATARVVGYAGSVVCVLATVLTLLAYCGAYAVYKRRQKADAVVAAAGFDARIDKLRRALKHDCVYYHAFVLLEACVKLEQDGFELRVVDPTEPFASEFRVLRPTRLTSIAPPKKDEEDSE